jgi:hypothetical protein
MSVVDVGSQRDGGECDVLVGISTGASEAVAARGGGWEVPSVLVVVVVVVVVVVLAVGLRSGGGGAGRLESDCGGNRRMLLNV